MRCIIAMIFACLVSMSLDAADTELKLYRPFGEAPLIVGETHAGRCWQQSQHIKREDAWRCMADGKTYDPCFIRQYGDQKQALCPQSPWGGSSVQLDLSMPADNALHVPLDMSQTLPWGLELESGETCLAVDEGQMFDSMPIRYQCNNQTLIFGRMQRCKMPWSILQRANGGQVETAIIKKAWF